VGLDFIPLGTNVVIAPGSSQRHRKRSSSANDVVVEGFETVVLTLAPGELFHRHDPRTLP
jgi:hypothetical protein